MKNIEARKQIIYKMFQEIFGEKSTVAESATALSVFFLYMVYLIAFPVMVVVSIVKALRYDPRIDNEI